MLIPDLRQREGTLTGAGLFLRTETSSTLGSSLETQLPGKPTGLLYLGDIHSL